VRDGEDVRLAHPVSAAAILAAPYEQRTAARVEVGLGERERLADPQACAPQHHDQAAQGGGRGCRRRHGASRCATEQRGSSEPPRDDPRPPIDPNYIGPTA
jgi:hypothetical protein